MDNSQNGFCLVVKACFICKDWLADNVQNPIVIIIYIRVSAIKAKHFKPTITCDIYGVYVHIYSCIQ